MSEARPEPSARHHLAPRAGLDRRQFLSRTALLSVGLPSLGLLDACARSTTAAAPAGAARITLAAPSHPVTWDIAADNPAITDGLKPEKNATLQLYNYADYIDPAAIKSFEKKYKAYNVKVAVSTFNDTDEAISKIRAGKVAFDIYFPSYDQISRMVAAKLIRPLNHSYLTNIANVWPVFSNPWYDQQWRYSVPYTVYTTGIGWRTDKVKADIAGMANPYDVLWDPAYKGKTAVIDDWHTAMGMALLRAGKTDINSDSADDLALIGRQLGELSKATSPKVTVSMYNDLPAGQLGVCQMWSGDVVNAVSYLPKGTSPGVLRYWFPPDGKGMVDNDLMVILRGGRNPVLAHLFVQHMLDEKVALANFGFIGYQPPQRSINPTSLVKQDYIPKNLASAVVKEEYFTTGIRLLELSATNDAAWHRVWQAFKAGG